MKQICPICEKETDVVLRRNKETFAIRGENVEVDAEYYQCTECNEEFENTRDYDALEAAYKEYRHLHGMLQPEEINQWRKQHGLTQKELAKLLGWGSVTLSRYENGALQDEAHEKILRLAMEPHNLKKLIKEAPNVLSKEKQDRLLKELSTAEDEAKSFEIIFEEYFGRYNADEYSGYSPFHLTKIFNAIIFFCKNGPLKTKLNKLLFYADFKHFKEYAVSITGAHYKHLQYGPVPDNYEFFTAELLRGNEIETEEVIFGDYSGAKYKTCVEPDLSVFSDSELKILAEVNEHFKDYTSTSIKDFSHNEAAYSQTRNGEVISYLYAKELQI